MIRVTRRDFLKYCSVAAGALGLSASTLMKIENVLAKEDNITTGGKVPDVVWISGAACTGCTMSMLNTVYYATIDDVLFNSIDLEYLDTAMATAGAWENPGVQYPGANALKQTQDIYNGGLASKPFVLCIEGALQTAAPEGGNAGEYCRIGDLLGTGEERMVEIAKAFANHPSCVAVLAIGTCSSFGGIPGARGSVTGAQGVAFTGTRQGGALVSNTVAGSIINVIMTERGTGYTAAPTVGFAGSSGSGASATATIGKYITITNGGTGWNLVPPPPNTLDPVAPYVTFTGGTLAVVNGREARAVITIDETAAGGTGAITNIVITDQGNYATEPTGITLNAGDTNGAGAVAALNYGVLSVTMDVGGAGTGYLGPDDTVVTFTGANTTPAAARAIVSVGGSVKNRTGLAAKVVNISGCPPHPDWIIGTIAYILDTYVTLPSVNRNYQPIDTGYAEYQCNAGPCPWRYNNTSTRPDENLRYPVGNSRALGLNKYGSTDMGCLGILGCKGRKTKADCSRRRWNADAAENYGVNWCVGSRGGCHGCTEPAFPDKVGKFFTFV